jgi:hypothetical protein
MTTDLKTKSKHMLSERFTQFESAFNAFNAMNSKFKAIVSHASLISQSEMRFRSLYTRIFSLLVMSTSGARRVRQILRSERVRSIRMTF